MTDQTQQRTLDTVAHELTKSLIDRGMIIEAGFASLMAMIMPNTTPPDKVDELRKFFFAGAQHTFGSIMSVLDPGEDPTDADLSRMDQIHTELDAFSTAMKLELGSTGKFPAGKLNPTDEGEATIAISDLDDQGNIHFNFGKPIAWFALPAAQAEALGNLLLKKARAH